MVIVIWGADAGGEGGETGGNDCCCSFVRVRVLKLFGEGRILV